METALFALYVTMHPGALAVLIFGWLRWYERPRQKNIHAYLSLAAFILATLSGVLAVGSMAFSMMRGGFAFYDPALLKIFRTGLSISLLALMCSLCGIWKPHTLRWFAPSLSLSMLVLWVMWATGE